jgi:hypothetical protein
MSAVTAPESASSSSAALDSSSPHQLAPEAEMPVACRSRSVSRRRGDLLRFRPATSPDSDAGIVGIGWLRRRTARDGYDRLGGTPGTGEVPHVDDLLRLMLQREAPTCISRWVALPASASVGRSSPSKR